MDIVEYGTVQYAMYKILLNFTWWPINRPNRLKIGQIAQIVDTVTPISPIFSSHTPVKAWADDLADPVISF